MTFKTGNDGASSTDNAMVQLDYWSTIIVPKSVDLDGISEEMLQTDGLPPILDFKSVMQNLQKTIAIDHAKKVREGKESVNMNGQLREKYSDYNYHFPDRILNAGLSKKDFTAPFLIDVKQIKQDMGNAVLTDSTITRLKDDVEQVKSSLGDRTTAEESKKRKESEAAESSTAITSSPTLYAMLEQPNPPAAKRIKVAPNAQIHSNNLTQSNVKLLESQTSTVKPLSPKGVISKQVSPQVTVAVKQNQTVVVTQNLVQPQHRQGLTSAAVTPSSRGKTTISIMPKSSQPYVSIRPKLPISVISPQRVVGQQQQQQQQQQGVVICMTSSSAPSPKENGVVGGEMISSTDKDTDDDFFPKIINTQGSVVMDTGTTTPDNSVQKNGKASSQPPKLVQIQPKRPAGSSGEATNKILKDERQNTTLEKREAVRGSGFLGCRHCGKTFPSNCDSLYRSHMIIKHSLEVSDAEILEAKIQVTSWYKCKKCSLMVLNNLEEHHKKCLPNLPFDHAFDPIQVLTDDVPKLACGLCTEAMDSRVNLRAHLQSKHAQINNQVLLDPFFRCGICLQYFADSKKLIEHVNNCVVPIPTPETAQEIAQKNLFCEICNKKHAKIRETLFCYQVKSLLRCVLCMHVSQSRQNFFNHLKMYHDRRTVGLCCPFCNDHVEKPTRQAFDHFIDNHLNVALKRAGEAALIRGRLAITQNPHNSNKSNNVLGTSMPGLTKSTVQVRRSMPTLKPKAIVPGTSQTTASAMMTTLRQVAPTNTSIQVPVSQVVQVSSGSTSIVGNGTFPPGTILARPVIINRGQMPQIPLQFSVVPATNLQSAAATVGDSEPSAVTDEDSILGM